MTTLASGLNGSSPTMAPFCRRGEFPEVVTNAHPPREVIEVITNRTNATIEGTVPKNVAPNPAPKDSNCNAAKSPNPSPHKALADSKIGQSRLPRQAASTLAAPTSGIALNSRSAGTCTCQVGRRMNAMASPPDRFSRPDSNQVMRLKMFPSLSLADRAH